MKIEKYGMAKMCGFGFISGSRSYEDGPVNYRFFSNVTFHALSKIGDSIRVSLKGYDCNISTNVGKGKYLFVFDGDDKCWKEYFTGIKVEPYSPREPFHMVVNDLGVDTDMVFDTVYALFLGEVPMSEFSLCLSLLSDNDKEEISNQIKWLSNAAVQWKEDCQNAINSIIRKRDEADSTLPAQPSQDDINNGFGKYGLVSDKNFNPNCSPRQAEQLQKKRESRENLHRQVSFMKRSKDLFVFSAIFLIVSTILTAISYLSINKSEASMFSIMSGIIGIAALLLSAFANELSDGLYWSDNWYTWFCKLVVTLVAVLCVTGIKDDDNMFITLLVWLIPSAVIFALQIIMGRWGRKLRSKAFENCLLRKSAGGGYIIPMKCKVCNGKGENDGGTDICTACKGWGFQNMR